MHSRKLKTALRQWIPPNLWRGLAIFKQKIRPRRHQPANAQQGFERPPEFYDEKFSAVAHRKAHYTHSPYFPLWTMIGDRIRSGNFQHVLDIGCGPGQVATMLRDQGLPNYKGIDFSMSRIAHARAICPEYSFDAADIREDHSLENYPYDCVIMLEFLEHIEVDLDVIKRIRPGATLIGTVPNFPTRSHVRHFRSVAEVEQRYSSAFREFDVREIVTDPKKQRFYLLQGII